MQTEETLKRARLSLHTVDYWVGEKEVCKTHRSSSPCVWGPPPPDHGFPSRRLSVCWPGTRLQSVTPAGETEDKQELMNMQIRQNHKLDCVTSLQFIHYSLRVRIYSLNNKTCQNTAFPWQPSVREQTLAQLASSRRLVFSVIRFLICHNL